MTGPLLARVAPSDPAAWSTELVCMPVRANPPQDTAAKLWVNNRGSGGPSQAIPQRIYIFTMESFVHRAADRQNPLSRAPSANAWPLAAGWKGLARFLRSLPARGGAISGTGDVVYLAHVSG